ncbi:MAG: MFS transporter [Clostridia bacterium]
MKLDYKRTLLVGLAFLSICAFWQLYDNVVPLILKFSFHMPDDAAGVIMALDNVLALFMLPLFGKLSDKSHTRLGKRMPYIVGGTAAAVVLMNLLPIADKSMNLPLFIVALALLLIAMGTYRAPAVALMPDVTPKALRSKGNAIINLMGALGGVFTLGVTGFLVQKGMDNRNDYTQLFLAVAILMAAAVCIMLFTVRENKLSQQAAQADAVQKQPSNATVKTALSGFRSLSPALRKSLVLILVSVFLWFMGYNAVTTAFTKYVSVRWGYDIKAATQCLMIATVGAVLAYLPVGMLSSKFGRKRMIQAGTVILTLSFGAAAFFPTFNASVYIVFALVGVAWAMINVNSYPMVVEISKSGDVGKFTGYYYAFSMAAQIVTPIASGWLLEHVGYHTLLPYAALMVALSFVTISMTKHGDHRPEQPSGTLEAFDTGDE